MKYTEITCEGIAIKSLTIAELLSLAGKAQETFKTLKFDNISEAMIRDVLVLFLNHFLAKPINNSELLALTSLQLDEIWSAICDLNPQLKLLNLAGSFLKHTLENNPEILLPKK